MMVFTVASVSSRVHVMKPWSRDTIANRAALPSVASIRCNHGVRGDDLNPISPGINKHTQSRLEGLASRNNTTVLNFDARLLTCDAYKVSFLLS